MDTKQPCLQAENEQLRAGYAAARLEIESLRERVQQLGQLARDVNSRRVTELEAETVSLTTCLRKANAEFEHFEREWYLRGDEIEALQAQLEAVGEGGVGKLAVAHPTQDRAVERDELLQAAINFIQALTGMTPPPIEVAPPEVFAPFRAFVEKIQEITDRRCAASVEPLRKRECLHQIAEPNQLRGATKLIAAARQAREALDWLPTSKHSQALWHRQQPALAAIREALEAEPQPAAQAAPEDASARFKAQHEFLVWNREQTPSPIESATEYSVFNQAVDFYLAARAAQGGA